MAIVPSGTRRTMIAQSFGRNNESGLGNLSGIENLPAVPEEGSASPQQPPTQEIEQPQKAEQPQQEEQGADDDLTSYITKKLQEMGYPPRRVSEFEDKMVEEKILPGSIREVTIVIPDRYYGMRRRVSGKDLAKLTQEVQAKFGLNFTGADRKEKKITMQFTSQKMNTGEEEVPGDYLDEVYGTPTGGTVKKRKVAQTMLELLKTSHTELIETIKKLGENNAPKK